MEAIELIEGVDYISNTISFCERCLSIDCVEYDEDLKCNLCLSCYLRLKRESNKSIEKIEKIA